MSQAAALNSDIETIAELRELYRAAEARAARLRLLSQAGHELAAADDATFDERLQRCASRLAFFLGRASAYISGTALPAAIPILAAGGEGQPAGWIQIDGVPSLEAVIDAEDREAVRLYLELLGAAMDRRAGDAERARLMAALKEREQRLEWLVARVFSAQESERRRVSQELHDGVAQMATALVRRLEGADPAAPGSIGPQQRAELTGIGRELLRELRTVIGGLRPTLLDDLGIAAALRALTETLEAEGYPVTLAISAGVDRLSRAVETALFRVAQEAITNIRKHAGGPCPVEVELILDDPKERYLRVRDCGAGNAGLPLPKYGEHPGSHLGIAIMRERITAIGGSLDWRIDPKGGVTVTAHLPKQP